MNEDDAVAALGGGGELGRKEMTSPYRRLAEMVAASRHGTTSGPSAAPVVVSDRDVGQKKEMFFAPVVAYFAPEVSKTRRGILGGLIVERGGTLAAGVDDPRVTHVLTTSTTYRHWDDTARLVSPDWAQVCIKAWRVGAGGWSPAGAHGGREPAAQPEPVTVARRRVASAPRRAVFDCSR